MPPTKGGTRTRKLESGEILFHEGERSLNVFIVKTGMLRVFKIDKLKGIIELANIQPNQIVGEMALFDRAPRSANVQAVVDTEVIELDAEKFQAYINQQPKWFRIFVESLLSKLRNTNEKLTVAL